MYLLVDGLGDFGSKSVAESYLLVLNTIFLL
jgi:hypothetical protein